MEDLKIFIVTHKECELPQLEGYHSLLVGANGKQLSQKFDYYDNTGDNISDKNSSYCELTGLYWIWKNVDADILGLCHYRRFFSAARMSISPAHYLKAEQIRAIMRDHDVILPRRLYFRTRIADAVRIAPNKADLEEIRTALAALYPDYIADYESYLNQRSWYMFNMCIMKRERLAAYCEWIFSVLAYIEAHHDMAKEEGYRSRLFGFLSERLIWVWVRHNIPSDRVKEVRVIRTDVGMLPQLVKDIKNRIKSIPG